MPHIANKLSLHTNSVEWNWQIFQGKRISGGVIFNVSSAFLICSAPDGWLLPLPYHPYWRTFLRASTCSATSWVLTQAGDEAEEAWNSSKVRYRGRYKLFRVISRVLPCSGRRMRWYHRACFSEQMDGTSTSRAPVTTILQKFVFIQLLAFMNI